PGGHLERTADASGHVQAPRAQRVFPQKTANFGAPAELARSLQYLDRESTHSQGDRHVHDHSESHRRRAHRLHAARRPHRQRRPRHWRTRNARCRAQCCCRGREARCVIHFRSPLRPIFSEAQRQYRWVMSVSDLHDVERTGEFAVTRIRRRPKQAKPDAPQSDAQQSDAKQIHATQSDLTQIDVTKRVPIAVLTDDATLADTIHDAAGASHAVATASTLDEAYELAAHGRCGILITDQLSTPSALRQMTQRLRMAEPALVVVAVGNTGDQGGLISLLSAGIVDRLMLKPLTPSLAQTVIKSATQQHRTLQGARTSVT